MKPTEATPVLATSNPLPPPPPEEDGVRSSLFSLASLAFNWPRWKDVALFFWVLAISASMSLILSTVVAMVLDLCSKKLLGSAGVQIGWVKTRWSKEVGEARAGMETRARRRIGRR